MSRYLGLLSSVFLIKSIPAWSSGQPHRAVGTPKLAFVDSGVASHLIGQDANRLGEPGGALHRPQTLPFGDRIVALPVDALWRLAP